MALPGFEAQVGAMDAGLLDPDRGLGLRLTLIDGAGNHTELHAFEPERNPERLGGRQRSGGGVRVAPGLEYQIQSSQIPTDWRALTVERGGDPARYRISAIGPDCGGLCSLSLTPDKPEAPSNGQWLKSQP